MLGTGHKAGVLLPVAALPLVSKLVLPWLGHGSRSRNQRPNRVTRQLACPSIRGTVVCDLVTRLPGNTAYAGKGTALGQGTRKVPGASRWVLSHSPSHENKALGGK